jgi:hypothetical protein
MYTDPDRVALWMLALKRWKRWPFENWRPCGIASA